MSGLKRTYYHFRTKDINRDKNPGQVELDPGHSPWTASSIGAALETPQKLKRLIRINRIVTNWFHFKIWLRSADAPQPSQDLEHVLIEQHVRRRSCGDHLVGRHS